MDTKELLNKRLNVLREEVRSINELVSKSSFPQLGESTQLVILVHRERLIREIIIKEDQLSNGH